MTVYREELIETARKEADVFEQNREYYQAYMVIDMLIGDINRCVKYREGNGK